MAQGRDEYDYHQPFASTSALPYSGVNDSNLLPGAYYLPSPFSPDSTSSSTAPSSFPLRPQSAQPAAPRRPSIADLPTTDRSCTGCRARKLKCSRTFPTCERCMNRAEVCEYTGEFRVESSSRPEGFQTAPRSGGTLRRVPDLPPSTTALNLISNIRPKPYRIATPISPLDTTSRIHSIFTADLVISHHLLLFETLLAASQSTSPRPHSSPPDIATSLVWYLLDAATTSCSLRLPGLRELQMRIPAYKSHLQNLDAAGKLAVVVLCLIGTRSSPQSTIFGASSLDTPAQVLEVGARRDRICKALVLEAVELAARMQQLISRGTVECLVGLTQVLADEYEHNHCRVVGKVALGMLVDLTERAGEYELVMGLELLKNDSYASAILQRPAIVHLEALGPSLRIPDFAQADFAGISTPRFQQQVFGSLSAAELERNLAIGNGWTSNCYRVFSSVAIDLNRSQLDWDLAATQVGVLWSRMDFVHAALQGLQQAIANSDTTLATTDELQDYALLVVGVDSRLIDIFLLLHTGLLRLETERGARGAHETMRALLAESQERVRKSLKLLSFYSSLYLASHHQELVYGIVWELEFLPEWTYLACQSFGTRGGPTSVEVELSRIELQSLEESVRLAAFYTPIAERRVSELESRHAATSFFADVASPYAQQDDHFAAQLQPQSLWTNPQPTIPIKHNALPPQWLPFSPASECDAALPPDDWRPYSPVAELLPPNHLSPHPGQGQPIHAQPYDSWTPSYGSLPPHSQPTLQPQFFRTPSPSREQPEPVGWCTRAEQEPWSERGLRDGVGGGAQGERGMCWQR